jgi:inhibitor of cysteine peptidase
MANGVERGTDLSKVARYQPTTLPPVFVSTTGSNEPALGSIDKMVTKTDNGSNVTLAVGDAVSVQLDSNPSTGYSWQITSDDKTVLEAVGEPTFDLGAGKTPVPGAGGQQTFNFKAVGKGTTTLTLVYVRPWEKNVTPTPANTFTVNVTVQ